MNLALSYDCAYRTQKVYTASACSINDKITADSSLLSETFATILLRVIFGDDEEQIIKARKGQFCRVFR